MKILIGFLLVLIGTAIGFVLNEIELQDYKKTNEILLNDLNNYKAACDIYMNERNFYHDGYMISLNNIRELEKKLRKKERN